MAERRITDPIINRDGYTALNFEAVGKAGETTGEGFYINTRRDGRGDINNGVRSYGQVYGVFSSSLGVGAYGMNGAIYYDSSGLPSLRDLDKFS